MSSDYQTNSSSYYPVTEGTTRYYSTKISQESKDYHRWRQRHGGCGGGGGAAAVAMARWRWRGAGGAVAVARRRWRLRRCGGVGGGSDAAAVAAAGAGCCGGGGRGVAAAGEDQLFLVTTRSLEVLLHNGGSFNACTIKRSIILLGIPKQSTVQMVLFFNCCLY